MKLTRLLALAVLAAGSLSRALGFAEFERGEFTLSTTARATYDSRVLGYAGSGDDYIFVLDPQLQYRREASQLKLDSYAGVRINRYADFTQFNSEDANAGIHLTVPPDVVALGSGHFATTYDERSDINYDVDQRLREKIFHSGGDAIIPIGLKLALLANGSYQHESRNVYSDRDIWDGGGGLRYSSFLGGTDLDLTYHHTKLDSSAIPNFSVPLHQDSDSASISVSRTIYDQVRGSISYGYRWLRRSRAEVLSGDPNTSGSLFSVNLDGPFLPKSRFPKLESSLTLGYEKDAAPGINEVNSSHFVGAARLTWQAREPTKVFVSARRSTELSVNNLTVVSTSGSLGVTEQIGHFISSTVSAGYERRSTTMVGRTDDAFTASAAARYQITKYWMVAFDYQFRNTNSNYAPADFGRHVVSVSGNYTF